MGHTCDHREGVTRDPNPEMCGCRLVPFLARKYPAGFISERIRRGAMAKVRNAQEKGCSHTACKEQHGAGLARPRAVFSLC